MHRGNPDPLLRRLRARRQAGLASAAAALQQHLRLRLDRHPDRVIRNGAGPTLYLGAGNHGDEYEGQITLSSLIRTLDPGEIQGRLIILPAANLPAAIAGQRCSPIDDGNLNRSFPGDPDGRPTAAIAHFIESVLLPLCDAAVDLHSGGKTLDYLPSALVRRRGAGDPLFEAKLAALRAFRAPIGYLVSDAREDRTLTAAADRVGHRRGSAPSSAAPAP